MIPLLTHISFRQTVPLTEVTGDKVRTALTKKLLSLDFTRIDKFKLLTPVCTQH